MMLMLAGLVLALVLTGACECGVLNLGVYVLLMLPTLAVIYLGGKPYVLPWT